MTNGSRLLGLRPAAALFGELRGGGVFGRGLAELVEARELGAGAVGVGLAVGPGVGARELEVDFGLVLVGVARRLKLLDGALGLARVEEEAAENVVAERVLRV